MERFEKLCTRLGFEVRPGRHTGDVVIVCKQTGRDRFGPRGFCREFSYDVIAANPIASVLAAVRDWADAVERDGGLQ